MVKMRIISQDGFIDLPYENIGVSININDNTEILAYLTNGYDRGFWRMAKYSTELKAQKAMDMLRNGYLDFMVEATQDGNGFCFNQPKVFLFPSDEDVEV